MLNRTQRMQQACSMFTMRVHTHLCTTQRQWMQIVAFSLILPFHICIWFCGHTRHPLRSMQGYELMCMSRTAWSVIKYLCPAAWSGKTHLDPEFCCQLLSSSPTQPPVYKADIP